MVLLRNRNQGEVLDKLVEMVTVIFQTHKEMKLAELLD